MSGLEFLVDCQDVAVERLREEVVDLLGEVDLGHLQLCQIVCHHSVFVIGDDHLFEDRHVFAGELTEALVDRSADARIIRLLAINDVLDVIVALVKPFTQLPEIPLHQLPILQHLLVLFHFFQAISRQMLPLIAKNAHGIAMLLPVEKHIKARSVQIFKAEFVGKLAKHRALLQVNGVYVEDL